MRQFGYLLAALIFCAATAEGRDIFVNNVSGSDLAGQQSLLGVAAGTPARTIAAALRVALPADRIIVVNTGRPYRESISFVGSRLSGTDYQPFMLVGNGAVLDGSRPIPPDQWRHYENLVFRFKPRMPGNQQLFVSGRPVPYVPAEPGTNLPPKLKPLQWSLVEGLVYFAVEPSKMPGHYDLSHAAEQTGITLYHVQRVAIVDLVVQGFRVDGIQAANSAREIRLVKVTARGNGRSGIAVDGACQVTLEGCTVGDNRAAQLLTLPLSETHVYASDLLPLTAPAWVDQGGRFFLADKPLQGGLSEIRSGTDK